MPKKQEIQKKPEYHRPQVFHRYQEETNESETIKKLENQLSNKTKEFEEMQRKLEAIIRNQNAELKRLREEKQKTQKNKEIKIFDSDSINEYETIENIDCEGQVVKVCLKKVYALKKVKLTNLNHDSFQNFINDIQIINMLNHPNILKTFKVFYNNEKESELSILLEYCQMNLEQAIQNKSLTKAQIVSFIIQIAEGMKYIHFRNLIHGSLKPSNVFIGSDGRIKIGDLGMFKLVPISFENKMDFIAPEKFCSDKADVYSFGRLMFFLLNEGNIIDIDSSSLSSFTQQIIKKCCNVDPQTRPNFKTICDELKQNKFEVIQLTSSENQELIELIDKQNVQMPLFY